MNQRNTITASPESAPGEEDFGAFVVQQFDPVFYRQAYPDVADSETDPLQHWLQCGLAEGRQISRYTVLRHGDVARRSSSRIWRHYHWHGKDIAVRLINPLPQDVITQIANQAQHDSTVLAAGADTLAQLSQQDRENVHLDIAGLRRALPRSPEFVLILPGLGTGTAGQLTVDLALVLSGIGPTHTIVVEQDSNHHLDPSAVPEPWRSIDVLFWRDFWIHGPESVNSAQLAQLISVVHPRVTIVADSGRGCEIVARYGRALSQRTKLYCLCAADAENKDTLHILQMLPFATALTDDLVLAARLRPHRDQPGHGVAVLPNHSTQAFRDAVAAMFGRP